VNRPLRSARYMKYKPVRAPNATVAVDRDKFVTNFELALLAGMPSSRLPFRHKFSNFPEHLSQATVLVFICA
jgi:hypothetical protein